MKPIFFLNVDVLSSCNLRCPTCPIGNRDDKLPAGYMSEDLLDAILAKAGREATVTGVGLFNWTEPFLHRGLPGLLRVVHRHKFLSYLSSNLNRVQDMAGVLEAEPHSIRISCSGWAQETYQRTHRNGDVNDVVRNMKRLAALKGPATKVHMLWHRYRHQEEWEEEAMADLCGELGFDFIPIDAYHMPLEDVLDVWEGRKPKPSVDALLVTSLASHRELVRGRKDVCRMQTRELTIDARGNVSLCCAVYDPAKFTLFPFLDTPLEKIQERRLNHEFCARCAKAGGHAYAMGRSKTPEKYDVRRDKVIAKAFPALASVLPVRTLVKAKEWLGL